MPLGSSRSSWPARSASDDRARRGERVAVGRDEDPVLVEEGLGEHLGVGDGEVDDGEVELVREEPGHQRGGRGVDHDHVHLRVRAR